MQNLICKLLGHKWRDTSSLQFKGNPRRDVWEVSRTCNRCDAFEVIRDEPPKRIDNMPKYVWDSEKNILH